MRRIVLTTSLIVSMCIAIGAQQINEGYSREYYPSAGTEDATIITKRIAFYDKTGRLEKVMNYLTEEASAKYGASIQIDQYNTNGKIASHTMIFNSNYQEKTGFTGRIDHEDENNTVTSMEFVIDQQSIYYADSEEMKFLEKYPVARMKYYYEKYRQPVKDEDHYIYEAPLIGGTTYVKYLNRMEDIPAKEKYLISNWAKMKRADYFAEVYHKRVLIREKEREIWACFQDELLPFLKKDLSMILRYYYIGHTIEGPTYLVTYMCELE